MIIRYRGTVLAVIYRIYADLDSVLQYYLRLIFELFSLFYCDMLYSCYDFNNVVAIEVKKWCDFTAKISG